MTNERFFVRHATVDDAILIATIGARMFRDAFGSDNRPEDMARYIAANFSPTIIEAELSDPVSTFLLAYEDERPIGYAMLRDGQLPASVKGPKPIELVRIYVDQHVIGKGYGSALMRFCLGEAEQAGYQTIWLGVWEKNARAIRIYEKWGFVTVGSHDFMLGSDVQNDLIMERPVKLAA